MLKKRIYFFGVTMLIGALASIVASIGLVVVDSEVDFWGTFVFNIGAGIMFSVLSMMGFFAYLTLNYLLKGFFRRRQMREIVQWIIIIIAAVDLVYLRFTGAADERTLLQFLVLPGVLMVGSVVVAQWKSKLTNATAFTPALFFMFVATLLESIPAIREDQIPTIWFMMLPLFFCNAWQILNLHHIVQKGKEN